MSAPPQSLSLFIPIYNEIHTLHTTVDRALATLSTMGIEYELILVDDGSTDGSGELADKLATQHAAVRVVHHHANLNYGRALTSGFSAARCDAVAYTDADLPVDLTLFADALPALADADLVSGYRVERKDSFRRALYSRIYNGLIRALFDVRVRDVNFSFKLVRRSLLENISLDATTVFIDGQLLIEATRRGARIVEAPVEYFPRKHGKSSFDSPLYAFATFLELLRYWWRIRRTSIPTAP